jgi:hypothetical protein
MHTKIRPEHNRKDASPKSQLQKTNGEEPRANPYSEATRNRLNPYLLHLFFVVHNLSSRTQIRTYATDRAFTTIPFTSEKTTGRSSCLFIEVILIDFAVGLGEQTNPLGGPIWRFTDSSSCSPCQRNFHFESPIHLLENFPRFRYAAYRSMACDGQI